MASKRMTKTAKFLSDVIITAVEGGIGYWSQAGNYDHGCDFDAEDADGNYPRTPASVTVYEMDDEEGGYKAEGVKVDNATISRAFKLIMGKDEIEYASRDWRKRMVAAYWAKDAGDLDSGDADCVVQIGMFGKVVYA